MNRKIIIPILIAILVLLLFALTFNGRNSYIPAGGQKNSCISASAEYKEKCIEANDWLDKKLVEWKPTKYNPMKFNSHMQFSSEYSVDTSNSDIDSRFYELIGGFNTDTISFFIYPDMFEKYGQRYDDLIGKVRSAGKQLYISYMVGDRYKYSSFEKYKEKEINFTETFVAKYHPDYYVVVDEPTTMERRTGLNVSDGDWKGLVIETANIVKDISPETKTVAIGHSQELEFLESLIDVKNLDLIGLNIWGITQIDSTTEIGKEIKSTIKRIEKSGKGVVFEQTWLTLMDEPEMKVLGNQEFMKDLDAKYVRAIVYYANLNNVSIYGTFYTGKFTYYGLNSTELIFALYFGNRTPVFYAYKDVISEVRNNTK